MIASKVRLVMTDVDGIREIILKAVDSRWHDALYDAFANEACKQLSGQTYVPQGLALVLLVCAKKALCTIYGEDKSMMSLECLGFICNWLRPTLIPQFGFEAGITEEVTKAMNDQFPAIGISN